MQLNDQNCLRSLHTDCCPWVSQPVPPNFTGWSNGNGGVISVGFAIHRIIIDEEGRGRFLSNDLTSSLSQHELMQTPCHNQLATKGKSTPFPQHWMERSVLEHILVSLTCAKCRNTDEAALRKPLQLLARDAVGKGLGSNYGALLEWLRWVWFLQVEGSAQGGLLIRTPWMQWGYRLHSLLRETSGWWYLQSVEEGQSVTIKNDRGKNSWVWWWAEVVRSAAWSRSPY